MGNHNYRADLYGDRRKGHFQQKRVITFWELTDEQQAFVLTHAPAAYALRISEKMFKAKERFADEAYLPALFDCARARNPNFKYYRHFLKNRTKKIWRRYAAGGLPISEFDTFPLFKLTVEVKDESAKLPYDDGAKIGLNMEEMEEIIVNLSHNREEETAYLKYFIGGDSLQEIVRESPLNRSSLILGVERIKKFLKRIIKNYNFDQTVFDRLREMVSSEEEYTYIKCRFFLGYGDRLMSTLYPSWTRHYFVEFFKRVDPLLEREFPE